MKGKLIAMLTALAMLLAMSPTAFASETTCAHVNVNELMKCEDCGSGICPICRQAGSNYFNMEPSCTNGGIWFLKCSTHGSQTGSVPSFGHIDENNDLLCDRCGNHDTLHQDISPQDHECDYCRQIISECQDVNPVDHKCDICEAELSEHDDSDPEDHYCDICNEKISECRDMAAPYNYCDICGKVTGCTHPAVDSYRICSDCGKQVCPSCNRVPETYELRNHPTCTEQGLIIMACPCSTAPGNLITWTIPALGHADANNDHYCDRCGISSCLDKNPADHKCDVCGEELSQCLDENPADHKCDICGKELSECVDENPVDHMCDICGNKLSECVDENPADHQCDICDAMVSQCQDTDPLNNICDICGKELECIHSDIDNYRICRTCGKQICPSCNKVPEVYQITTNPTCEGQGMIVMACPCSSSPGNLVTWTIPALGHVDANKDHVCDRSSCQQTLSECSDENPKDHMCDVCGEKLSECSDENPKDHMCDVCAKTLSSHTGGKATCTTEAICDHCGQGYGGTAEENHTGEAVWTKTEMQHEQKWSCCGVSVVPLEDHEWENGVCTECKYVCQHTGGTATCKGKAVCEICEEEYGELDETNHVGETFWSITMTRHGQGWSCCGAEVVPVEKHKWENGVCTKCKYACRHTGGTATCKEQAVCEICEEKYGETNTGNHIGTLSGWQKNGNRHWKYYSCCPDVKVDEADHSGGTATCQMRAACSACDEPYGELDETNHGGEKVWTKTETQHEQRWSCCEAVVVVPLEEHEWKNGMCTECDYRCAHTFDWQEESGKYWKKCSICSDETEKKDIPAITINGADTVCITQDYKFSITLPEGAVDVVYAYAFESKSEGNLVPTVENGKRYGVLPADCYAADEDSFKITVTAKTDDGFEISADKDVALQKEHSGGTATCTEQAICEVCGASYGETDSTNHDLKNVPAVDATVTDNGNIEYWKCKDCENSFSDQEGQSQISTDDTVIAKLPPEIVEGMGQSVTKGKEKALAFRSNAAFVDFIRVEVDGNTLDEKNYNVREGSTVVTLNADYVATLSAGEHMIGIVSESGTASTSFTVAEKDPEKNPEKDPEKDPEKNPEKNPAKKTEKEIASAGTDKQGRAANKSADTGKSTPDTGDETPLGVTVAVMMLSAAILSVLLIQTKKRRADR